MSFKPYKLNIMTTPEHEANTSHDGKRSLSPASLRVHIHSVCHCPLIPSLQLVLSSLSARIAFFSTSTCTFTAGSLVFPTGISGSAAGGVAFPTRTGGFAAGGVTFPTRSYRVTAGSDPFLTRASGRRRWRRRLDSKVSVCAIVAQVVSAWKTSQGHQWASCNVSKWESHPLQEAYQGLLVDKWVKPPGEDEGVLVLSDLHVLVAV